MKNFVFQLDDRVKFTMGDYSYFCDKDNAANSAGRLEDLLGRLEKHAGNSLYSHAPRLYLNSELIFHCIFSVILQLSPDSGKQKPKEWIQLAKEGNFEKLTKELIVEYYDKNYKKPRGDPLATYEVIFH